ncbi:cytochrome c family protein [Aquibium carbonis]|uniref:Cytochrome c family protein n=1 Tax=Aquibium carbonis TaxID=2495581 RepID=A0A3R9Y5J6_9HYPH|nr:cytochrome c family protein [Aquibium carbonis]RST84706.1 cytochrome c family protein [Aquibium carbonis]
MKSFIRIGVTGAVLMAGPAAAIAQDLAKGETLFRRCAVCHGIGDTSKPVGPSLNNVIGRTAGTEESFASKYSKAMIAAGEGGLVWTVEEISEYITDPRKKVPGNKMAFPGLKKEDERADVIAYIAQFSTAAAAEPGEEEAAEPAAASQ